MEEAGAVRVSAVSGPAREGEAPGGGRASLEPVVDMLAFFVAMRNYGYADAIGNALEPATALEVLGSALRDFRSLCLDSSPQARRRLAAEKKVACPSVGGDELEGAVEMLRRMLVSRGRRGGLVQLLREIYVSALARASRFRLDGEERGGGGVSG